MSEPTWAQKLEAVHAAGLSFTEIGELIGLTSSGVSNIRRGKNREPRGMVAVRLHELYREKRKQRMRQGPLAAGPTRQTATSARVRRVVRKGRAGGKS